jgi:hypothetical protein
MSRLIIHERRGFEQLIGYIVIAILTKAYVSGQLEAWLEWVPFFDVAPRQSTTGALIELFSLAAWGIGVAAILIYTHIWNALHDIGVYVMSVVRSTTTPAQAVIAAQPGTDTDPLHDILAQIVANQEAMADDIKALQEVKAVTPAAARTTRTAGSSRRAKD